MKPLSEGKLLEDRISELPAEILVDILSKLKTKESGSTSILSRRWRDMWTRVYNLDFDGSEVLADVDRKIKCFEVERPIYVNRVNEALRLHQRQTIDRFVVVFSLDDSFRADIDGWVSFAVRKRVQRLELHSMSITSYYSFPNSMDTSNCRSLTSLHLDKVDITGEMIELFLQNCLNLERVCVCHSLTLLSLNIGGPSLKLKWLELHECHNMECLNVSAPNLVSFEYSGKIISMPLKYVPKLLDLSISGLYGYYINSRLSDLCSCLSKLEKLTLGAWIDERDMRREGVTCPVFPKLTHLTLIINSIGFKEIFDFASLINGCPSLYYFSFETWMGPFRPRWLQPFITKASSPNTIREVVLKGFRGDNYEIEMANYFIENAAKLEKITFDVMIPSGKGKQRKFYEPTEREINAREHSIQRGRERAALHFGKIIRPGVEVVIG